MLGRISRGWTAAVRRATTQDFARLGCSPELVGRWRSSFDRDHPEIELAEDGAVRSVAGATLGRWVVRDRLLLLYFPGWGADTVRQLVRAEGTDRWWGSGVGFRTLGDDVDAVWRGPEPLPDAGVR